MRVGSAMRTFDPVRIGRLETVAWVAYYRREWLKFLRAAVPDNDPDGARRTMRRFYALVARTHGETFDIDQAARSSSARR